MVSPTLDKTPITNSRVDDLISHPTIIELKKCFTQN